MAHRPTGHHGITRSEPGQRGAVLLLVLLAVAIAMVGGLTFLVSSTTASGIAVSVDEHAQSRQIAESGIDLALRYMSTSETWMIDQPNGTWVNAESLEGGTVTITGSFAAAAIPATPVDDHSFEDETRMLPSPLLFPPASGTIGGWDVRRSGLVWTGPTLPTIGTAFSLGATDGVNQGLISFALSVVGSAEFSQGLGFVLAPNHTYEIKVDIRGVGLPPVLGSFGYRLYSGGDLVVTTEEGVFLLSYLTLPNVIKAANTVLVNALRPCTLVRELIVGDTYEYTMRFTTGDSPPTDPLTLELFADSVGVVTSVWFDNVRIESVSNEPVRLIATGRVGDASHTVAVLAEQDLIGGYRIIEWLEP